MWSNGKIELFPQNAWGFWIPRDGAPELRKLILKAQDWANVARKEHAKDFRKPLGEIGSVRFVFHVSGRFSDDNSLDFSIYVGDSIVIPLSHFTELLSDLDNLPAMETELNRLDAAFK